MNPSFPIRDFLASSGSHYSRMPDLDKVRTARAHDTHLDPDYELHYHGPSSALAENAKVLDSLASVINAWSANGGMLPSRQMLDDMEVAIKGEGLIMKFLLRCALSNVARHIVAEIEARP